MSHILLRLVTAAVTLMAVGCGRSAPTQPTESNGATRAEYRAGQSPGDVSADSPGKYTLAVSLYTGWMPWYYADEAGVLAKWAEREGIQIDVVAMDYIGSVEAFVAGQVDACLMTNMEALDLPAAAGVDTTVLIVGDYSDGNDKILARGIDSVAGLRGAEIALVELSVSDYLLNRALESAGLTPRDVKLVNTGESKIGSEFLANKNLQAVVTWNPLAMQLAGKPGVKCIYDSSKTPGEILDLCVVNSETLGHDPRLGRALVGAWFEVLAAMQRQDSHGRAALAKMAELAGGSVAEFESQLATTHMFWTPAAAAAYAQSTELQQDMESVRQFCFAKKLLGEYTQTVDDVGIAYPDGTVQGRPDRVKLRFDTEYVRAAAE